MESGMTKTDKITKAERVERIHHERGAMLKGEANRRAIESKITPAHLAATLARRCPEFNEYQIGLDVGLLLRIGKQLASLALADCNYGMSPRQKTRRENLAKQAATIAAWYGLTADAYGDPRGYVLKLQGDDLTSNCFGGQGFGVA
jgi:hypothetical protein